MKKSFVFFLICIFLLGTSVCSFAEMVDRILAKVGTEAITSSDYQKNLNEKKLALEQRYGKQKGQVEFAKYKARALEEMVLQRILEAEITREKITVSNEDVEEEYQNRVQRSGMNATQFIQELAGHGLSIPQYKKMIKQDLEQQKFVQKKIVPQIHVSDLDIKKAYEKNPLQYKSYSKLRFIEVFLTPDQFKNQEELLKVAEQIHKKLKTGQNVKLDIQKYSSGAFKDKGGDSGVMAAKDLRPDIVNVLQQLKPGDVSPLIPTDQGVYFFKLVSQADPQPLPFAQVARLLRSKATEQQIQKKLKQYLLAVKDQTYVEILK